MTNSVAILTRDPLLAEEIHSMTGAAVQAFEHLEAMLNEPSPAKFSSVGIDLRKAGATEIGFENISVIRDHFPPHVRLIAITDGGMAIEQARHAVLFADDELDIRDKSRWLSSEILTSVARTSRPRLYSTHHDDSEPIHTFSTTYLTVLERMRSLANLSIPILITGETGTGKSTTARHLHAWSNRALEPFMILACGAVPGELLESDLFGHARGAFTSANQQRIGRLEAVGRGTLLLDEVDLLQLEQQAKLLRAVETAEFEPVGSVETRKTHASFIFASNVDLIAAVNQQRFRADLFYRINVLDLTLPPLRERREDLPLLAVNCLGEVSKQFASRNLRVSLRFLRKLNDYHWPGNIRELKNRLVRAALLSPSGELQIEDLGCYLAPAISIATSATSMATTLRQNRKTWERESIERVLRDYRQNRTAAAKALGISRATLYKKMSEYGVEFKSPDGTLSVPIEGESL
jgi:DNA-binding NtrC family response regulator